MKYFFLAFICLATKCLIAQTSYNTPISRYGPSIEEYFRFSPIRNSPDSLLAKMLRDEDFVLDTLYPHSDTVNFYMRGYYKTFNPFSLRAERVEVYLLVSDVMENNKETGRKVLTYMILGIVGKEKEDLATVTEEAKRMYKKLGKVVKSTSIQHKKNKKDKTYLRYLYDVGFRYPFYSGFSRWYKNETDFCVYFSINLFDLERLKRQEAAQ